MYTAFSPVAHFVLLCLGSGAISWGYGNFVISKLLTLILMVYYNLHSTFPPHHHHLAGVFCFMFTRKPETPEVFVLLVTLFYETYETRPYLMTYFRAPISSILS